jgi:hypothetical protein
MTRSRRQKRREARELADHHRALNMRHEIVKTAKQVRDRDQLIRALETLTPEERLLMLEALKPHLAFAA